MTGRPLERQAASRSAIRCSASGLLRAPQRGSSKPCCTSIRSNAAPDDRLIQDLWWERKVVLSNSARQSCGRLQKNAFLKLSDVCLRNQWRLSYAVRARNELATPSFFSMLTGGDKLKTIFRCPI